MTIYDGFILINPNISKIQPPPLLTTPISFRDFLAPTLDTLLKKSQPPDGENRYYHNIPMTFSPHPLLHVDEGYKKYVLLAESMQDAGTKKVQELYSKITFLALAAAFSLAAISAAENFSRPLVDSLNCLRFSKSCFCVSSFRITFCL